jgi:hypothetical protein
VIGVFASGGKDRLRAGDELGELAQVLDCGGEGEFVTSAGPYAGSIARIGPASETLVWTAPASQGPCAAGTGLVDCGHVSGLGVRPCRPQAQMGYADRAPNITAGSTPQRVSRGVPILGSTDRHLAAISTQADNTFGFGSTSGRGSGLQAPGQIAGSFLGRKRPAIKLNARAGAAATTVRFVTKPLATAASFLTYSSAANDLYWWAQVE